MWEKIRLRIIPGVFLPAMLIGFCLCCVAGRCCASQALFENFRRFHGALNGTTMFFPTVSQMIATVKPSIETGKTIIIVGGNSIANGRGQGSELWTDQLQKRLGPSYKVFNFAQPGMGYLSSPFLVYWSIFQRYPKTWYVANDNACWPDSIELPFQKYPAYWDARFKGLIANTSSVDLGIHQRVGEWRGENSRRVEEAAIGGFLDSFFYFQDLWSTVGYRYFFSVWTHDYPTFRARKTCRDDRDFAPLPVNKVRADLVPSDERFRLSEQLKSAFKLERSRWSFDQSQVRSNADLLDSMIPYFLRSHMLVMVLQCNPYVYEHYLTKEEQKMFAHLFEVDQDMWRKINVSTMFLGPGIQEEDFLDGLHHNGKGATKLSALVARFFEEHSSDSNQPPAAVQRAKRAL